MSKTTLNPDAKTMGLGNTSKPIEDAELKKSSKSGDTYESVGASKWKAFTSYSDPLGLQSSPLPDISDQASALGDAIERTLDEPILSADSFQFVGPFNLRMRKTTGNEYLEHFSEVDLPPKLTDIIKLYPKNKTDLKASIRGSRDSYLSYLALHEDRKANAVRTLQNGRISSLDATALNQFIAKLDDAIEFTTKQLTALKGFEKDKIGE